MDWLDALPETRVLRDPAQTRDYTHDESHVRGPAPHAVVKPRSREARVFKFSVGGERLSAIKREATLMRVLRDTLGERADLVRVLDWNFEAEPYFIECEYGGESLPDWARARSCGW